MWERIFEETIDKFNLYLYFLLKSEFMLRFIRQSIIYGRIFKKSLEGIAGFQLYIVKLNQHRKNTVDCILILNKIFNLIN